MRIIRNSPTIPLIWIHDMEYTVDILLYSRYSNISISTYQTDMRIIRNSPAIPLICIHVLLYTVDIYSSNRHVNNWRSSKKKQPSRRQICIHSILYTIDIYYIVHIVIY